MCLPISAFLLFLVSEAACGEKFAVFGLLFAFFANFFSAINFFPKI